MINIKTNFLFKLFLFMNLMYLELFSKIYFYNRQNNNSNDNYIVEKNENKKKTSKKNNTKFDSNKKCFLSPKYSNIKIKHFIFTRFMIQFYPFNDFPKKIYKKDYIKNGIRVLKKYLFPSLENQSCKDFVWILLIGNKANKTYIKSILDFDNSFKYNIIYEKELNKYVREQSKDIDILITTRIDYDDQIYYNAVNDIRKIIDIDKPAFLHGYNRGLYFFEYNQKYYEYYNNFDNKGVMSVFFSLIINLHKVNDSYTILDLREHNNIKKYLLNNYKSFGIKNLNYDPALFDESENKFIYVRQKYAGSYNHTVGIPKCKKEKKFNQSIFYGKY